jgi:ABC-type enterochelin transport system permease subunit
MFPKGNTQSKIMYSEAIFAVIINMLGGDAFLLLRSKKKNRL